MESNHGQSLELLSRKSVSSAHLTGGTLSGFGFGAFIRQPETEGTVSKRPIVMSFWWFVVVGVIASTGSDKAIDLNSNSTLGRDSFRFCFHLYSCKFYLFRQEVRWSDIISQPRSGIHGFRLRYTILFTFINVAFIHDFIVSTTLTFAS